MVTKDRIDNRIFASHKSPLSDLTDLRDLLASITAPVICKMPSSLIEEVLNTIEQLPSAVNNNAGDLQL